MDHGNVLQELSCVSFILTLSKFPSTLALSCFTCIILHASNVCMSGAYCQTQAWLLCNHKLRGPLAITHAHSVIINSGSQCQTQACNIGFYSVIINSGAHCWAQANYHTCHSVIINAWAYCWAEARSYCNRKTNTQVLHHHTELCLSRLCWSCTRA